HEATAVMDRLRTTVADRPHDYPALTWIVEQFDLAAVPPVGWTNVYADVRRFVTAELRVPNSSALDCVLTLQHALMPRCGREFPSTVELPHDYLAYYRSAARSLYVDGSATTPAH